jgi:predicted CXXCH cytochrome family protein
MLKEEGGKLCAMCHRDYSPKIYEAIDTAEVKHPPVDSGACVDCHRPHSSQYASLLKNSMEKLCFSCHDELGETVGASQYRHGPVQTGDCTACHNVHGSKFTKLLARLYPLTFYIAYAPENYDLCFGCHNKEIAKNRTTESLTNFRDGDYNLHYFHVNNEKGRTCTACHDPHASNQPKHIRYEVPFGDWWSYPINITKTETGATCVVGCHAPKGYDRINPRMKK